MTAAALITQAGREGVLMVRSPAGNIKASGVREKIKHWLPIIRDHKPAILEALLNGANDAPHHDFLLDEGAEDRRQGVLSLLKESPGIRYAIVTDADAEPDVVVLTMGIQDKATAELRIPKTRYNGFALMELLERHPRGRYDNV